MLSWWPHQAPIDRTDCPTGHTLLSSNTLVSPPPKLKLPPKNNAMFHSSFPSDADADPDPTLLPAVCSSAATPQPFYDAGTSHPLLFSSSSPPYPSSFPHHLDGSSSILSLLCLDRIPDQPPFLSFPHHHSPPPPPPPLSSPFSTSGDYFDFNSADVRRVFSTHDLPGTTVTQAAGDNYNQEVSAIPGRIGRHTAEERKDRIERYRSKRCRRNFNKKITYACRKTLADGRPRVHGRFARNGETETRTEPEVKIEVAENSYNRHSSYNMYEQAPSGCCGNGDWWSQVMAALATGEEEEFLYQDICANFDVSANFSDVLDMNLPF